MKETVHKGDYTWGLYSYMKGTVNEGDCTYLKETAEHMLEIHSTGKELQSIEVKIYVTKHNIIMYLYNTKLYCSADL